jgi:hypothetical protein
MRPYPGAVFGRSKAPDPAVTSSSSAPEALSTDATRPQGKGRPTPSRREAEARNKRPLVGATAPAGATKAERKAARQARSAQVREERSRSRQALISGDERALPAKDKGPVRRFARDYIDARRNLGEYFLPIALISLLVGILNIPVARLASLVVLYAMVVVIALDSYLLRRRVQRLADARFNEKGTAGVGTYAMMRSLQFRRGRLPKPQVGRGEWPAGSK